MDGEDVVPMLWGRLRDVMLRQAHVGVGPGGQDAEAATTSMEQMGLALTMGECLYYLLVVMLLP